MEIWGGGSQWSDVQIEGAPEGEAMISGGGGVRGQEAIERINEFVDAVT